jgi:hypothetical protein
MVGQAGSHLAQQFLIWFLGDIQERLYPISALALRVGARLPRPMRVFSFSEITLRGCTTAEAEHRYPQLH